MHPSPGSSLSSLPSSLFPLSHSWIVEDDFRQMAEAGLNQ